MSERMRIMKILQIGAMGLLMFSCSSNSKDSDSKGTDTTPATTDSATDTGEPDETETEGTPTETTDEVPTDTDVDTGTGMPPCGERLSLCCEDAAAQDAGTADAGAGSQCNAGLDPIPTWDAQGNVYCFCEAACTFSPCTAGSETGVCYNLYGTDVNACQNDLDLPMELATAMPDDTCTLGETCTTASGDDGGTCISVPIFGGTPKTRCAVLCDDPPTGCEVYENCMPGISIAGGAYQFDWTDGHCVLVM